MSWIPSDKSVKMLDLSQYQNWANSEDDRTKGHINFKKLRKRNPDIKVIILRAAGAWSGIDKDFEYNYDAAGEEGYDLGVYINNNPANSTDYMLNEWWGPALLNKNPDLIVVDAETNGWKDKDNIWHGVYQRYIVTDRLEEMYNVIASEWSESEEWTYSGHFWGENLVYRDWMPSKKLWTPHYWAYTWDTSLWNSETKSYGMYRQVYSYKEIDPFMPEKRDFIPRLPTWIQEDQIIAWQFTEKGIIDPISCGLNSTPRVDLNYLLPEEYNRIWGNGNVVEPPIEPPVEPPVVVPGNCVKLTVTVNVLNVRSEPSITGRITGKRFIGNTVNIDDIHVDNDGSVWSHDELGWSAVVYRNNVYQR